MTTYSEIIGASKYVRIMGEHVHMAEADVVVAATTMRLASEFAGPLVADLGCGPGRITRLLTSPGVRVLGLDIDDAFLEHAKKLAPHADYVKADLIRYVHPVPVDVAVSHGLHHHIHPLYLENASKWIRRGGYYVVGDEFLPQYSNNKQRQVRAVAWYSYVIASALQGGFHELAREEAKTLLDDLQFGKDTGKSEKQITLVLESAPRLQNAIVASDWLRLESLAEALLGECLGRPEEALHEPSRGDHKICHSEFMEQLVGSGFAVVDVESVGPANTVGGFRIYVLQKVS
jgi:SAM-dependent methyltransferase